MITQLYAPLCTHGPEAAIAEMVDAMREAAATLRRIGLAAVSVEGRC